jgi:hypothetical protein
MAFCACQKRQQTRDSDMLSFTQLGDATWNPASQTALAAAIRWWLLSCYLCLGQRVHVWCYSTTARCQRDAA